MYVLSIAFVDFYKEFGTLTNLIASQWYPLLLFIVVHQSVLFEGSICYSLFAGHKWFDIQHEYSQLLERSEAAHKHYHALLILVMIMAITKKCFKYRVDICTLFCMVKRWIQRKTECLCGRKYVHLDPGPNVVCLRLMYSHLPQ